MDSYDLFGEDVAGGMLDGLADLGSDNFEPQGSREQGQNQAQPQQGYPSYSEHMHQESPLQKLASFGGEFASNHLETGGMYHGGTSSSYGEAAHPMQQPYHPGTAGQRSMMQPGRTSAATASASQYPSYGMQQDNMYSMDQQQQGMADWNYPGMRHYGQVSQAQGQPQYRPQIYQPEGKMTYSQQAQPSMMIGYQQQGQRSQAAAYQQMYSAGSSYGSYPTAAMHQQAAQRMPHHMQYQQQMLQESQYYQQAQQQQQQQQSLPSNRSLGGVDAAPTAPSASPASQTGSYKGSAQGGSPQYRPPFPQLSPQMSPRQMSPRPQMSSPRPVVSPAKPNLSPRHKPTSGSYPPQTTLQQLEQMVMPPTAPQDYPQYRPSSQWPPRQSHNGPDMPSYSPLEEPKPQNDMRVPTPHSEQPPSLADFPQSQRDKFSSPSHMPQTSEISQNLDTSGSQVTPPTTQPKPLDTGQYSDMSGYSNKMDDMINHSDKTLSELGSSGNAGPMGLSDTSSLHQHQQPMQQHQPHISPQHQPSIQQQSITSQQQHQQSLQQMQQHQQSLTAQQQHQQSLSQSHQQHPQSISQHQPQGMNQQHPQTIQHQQGMPQSQHPVTGGQYGTGYPGDMQHMMQSAQGPQQGMYPDQSGCPPSLYQSPISHQQEMAALQQQLQEAYCMTPAPDTQIRIQHLQERINMLQHHEANDQCLGGPHCLLQSPMWQNTPAADNLVQASPGRGRGRTRGRGGGSGQVGRPRKPRKKAGEIMETPPQPPPPQQMMGAMMGGYMGGMMPNMMGPGMVGPPSGMVPQASPMEMASTPVVPPTMIPPPHLQEQHTLPPSSITGAAPMITSTAPPHMEPSSTPPMEEEQEPPPERELTPSPPPQPTPASPPPLEPVESPFQPPEEPPPALDAEESSEETPPPLEQAMPTLEPEEPMQEAEPPPLEVEEPSPTPAFSSPPLSPSPPELPVRSPSPLPPPQQEEPEEEEEEEDDTTREEEIVPVTTSTDNGNVFNFTDDEELPPPPLHGDPDKKKTRKNREPKKPKEPKPPKEPKLPKPPKEPKSSKPRTPKTPKEPKKKREPKISESLDESTTPKKRGKKKKKKEESEEEVKPAAEESFNTTSEGDNLETTPIKEDKEEVESEQLEQPKEEEAPEDSITPKKKDKKKDKGRPKSKKASKSQSKRSKKGKAGSPDDNEGPPPSSPADDDSNKRRSARNTQRKKYVDDIMLSISDEESSKNSPKGDSKHSPEDSTHGDQNNKPNFVYVNTSDEDSMVVQTILATRKVKKEVKVEAEGDKSKENKEEKPEKDNEKEETKDKENEKAEVSVEEEVKNEEQMEDKSDEIKKENEESEKAEKGDEEKKEKEDEDKGETQSIEVDEYYVKYRNFSYLHCEWKTEEELTRGDKRMAAKIKRFKQKMATQTNIFENLEEDPFNPDYVEVERVLDVSELQDPNSGTTIKHYLVKWRALQYEDSTWELQDDVDPAKIEQFERFSKLPSKEQLKIKKKPTSKEWEKLESSPVYKNENTLRDYQLEGLNWLLFSWYNGRNCILADEMGLGKTIQSLTFIHAAYEYGIRGPFLVIAPLSTIPNWQREFEAWTDLNVVVYHGSAASRNMLQEYELHFRNEKGIMKDIPPKVNVLITTFEIIITDIADLKDFHWRICVIDEAHRLKNRNCKLLEGLRTLNLEHRVLLSGTPLQNNVNELFSLLNFLEPQQFSSCEAFVNEFGALKSETEVQKLQLLLKPMMLRRLKEDVEKTLAPKEETVVEVELTNIQKKYYRGILERNFSFLSKGTSSANVPNLMNTMMELRKCCIHPYLLNGAEDQIQHDYKQSHGEDADAYYKALIQSSGKMVLIDKLLPKLKDNGHRVLIFSQMVRCLDILEDYLVFRKYPFERIDGRIRGNLRQAAIDRFCKPDSDRFVFLLCTKAGGLGINLTAADTVIIYDSDWNPQNDLQAQARCHRIGQQKMVKVYRLLCRNTYEREMFDKASLKLGLDKAILQSMNTSQGGKDTSGASKQLSKKEIEDLLKKGAYGAIMDDDNAADKFCEEDIDQILERRTQVITLESEKGSTFSKASFQQTGIRHDIDIDDPDFWKKWAKKADIDTSERDEQSELLVNEPRRRTQIKRYGHDDAVMDMSDLDTSSGADSDNDNDPTMGRRSKNKNKKHKFRLEEYQTSKEGDISHGTWARSECFKVERGLLTFGWGRWHDILLQNQFREGWKESDIEECARIIILYCLRFYRGDDKIRTFIWELITPADSVETSKNHADHVRYQLFLKAANNIPRGRKAVSRRLKTGRDGVSSVVIDEYSDHWSRQERYDGDIFLESNYRKHLSRHANKLLLRIRMLYYIKHEIIGELVHNISEGTHISCLGLMSPHCDQSTSPAPWWDREADKSLVVGTYKHGYEGYARMRADPTLSFLPICGPPPSTVGTSTNQPQSSSNHPGDDGRLSDDEDGEGAASEAGSTSSASLATSAVGASATPPPSVATLTDPTKPQWPSMVDLNHRLRRVINSYQRNFKKEELKLAQKAKQLQQAAQQVQQSVAMAAVATSTEGGSQSHPTPADLSALMAAHGWDWHQLAIYLWKMERREKYEQMARERERQKLEVNQRKWSKREEQDFYRTVSSYGIDYNRQKKKYEWSKFRILARLEKKFDDTMTEYFLAFMSMCKRICGIKPSPEEESIELAVESVSEERARRVLERISLLSKIREEILIHPRLDERLALCQPSADTPDWWIPGKHDKDLLIGVSKHGLGRTDIYILNDPELSFYAITQRNLVKGESSASASVKTEKADEQHSANKNEIIVKLEKGEGTLKIEKVGLKLKEELKVKEEVNEEEKENKEEVENKENDVKNDELPGSEIKEESETNKTNEGDSCTVELNGEETPEKAENPPVSNKSEMAIDSETPDQAPLVNSPCKDAQQQEAEKEDKPDGQPSTEDKEVTADTSNNKETDTELTGIAQDTQIPDACKSEKSDTVNSAAGQTETLNPTDSNHQQSQDKGTQPLDQTKLATETNYTTAQTQVKKETVSKATEVEGIEKFKALFPELEVMQKLPEIDTTVVSDKQVINVPKPCLDSTVAQIIAHSYQNHIKWPKEHALQVRLEHIVHAVETGEWPVGVGFSAYSECGTSTEPTTPGVGGLVPPQLSHHLHQLAAAAAASSGGPPTSEPHSEVITITTDHGLPRPAHHHSHTLHATQTNKRKRHITLDVETERAKLHALLNSTNLQMQQQQQHNIKSSPWDHTDESLSEDSRRSTPGLQPPPAHQQISTTSRVLSLPFDLTLGKVATPSSSPASPAPVTSTAASVLDLSAKTSPAPAHASSHTLSHAPLDLTPQDFSIKHKQSPASTSTTPLSSKSKLDDTLSKLMQRKNCPIEEPVVGKEKKRRKLDEIVLGLSAAKEQMKGSSEKHRCSPSPSVTVTTIPCSTSNATNLHSRLSSSAASLASSSPSPKDLPPPSTGLQASPSSTQSSQPPPPTPLSAYLEQHNQLLRQQHSLQQQFLAQQHHLKPNHHRQKTYDQMIADITKVSDFSAKMTSFSNEAKVNKWLAEQSGAVGASGAEAGMSTADFLARRRRPRVDPTLLDWKKLTGEENVSVINRITGKKLTGSKAPQLKRLAQWLLENPMYDVDPKWAELVKERGNLPSDLAKRVNQAGNTSSSLGGMQHAAAAAAAAAAAVAAAKKGPGRPPLMASPPGGGSSSSSNPQSNLQFPSLAGINPALLSLGGFDPKNPLLFPFGSLSGLTNVNLTNSLFANLAGLGLPGLGEGMDQPSTSKQSKPLGQSSSRSKAPDQPKSSLPFFFPNPSLLYSPLGLGGLNPFSLQPGGAYDSLGLLNGGIGGGVRAPPPTSKSSSTSRTSTTSTPTSSQSSSRPRQQFVLPQDTQLLESLSRAQSKSKSSKQSEPYPVDSLRGLMAAASLPASFKPQDKETLEALSRTSADLLFARLPQDKKPEDLLIKRKRETTPFSVEDLGTTKKSRPELTIEKREDSSLERMDNSSIEPVLVPSPRPGSRASSCEVPLPATTPVPIAPTVAHSPPVVPPILPVIAPSPPVPVTSPPVPATSATVQATSPSSSPLQLQLSIPVIEDPLPLRPTEEPHQLSQEKMDTSPIISPSLPAPVPEEPPPPPPVQKEEPPEPKAKSKGKGRGKKSSPSTSHQPMDVVEKKNLRSSAGRAAAAAAARQRAASLEHSDT